MTTWYLVALGTAVQRTTSGRTGHVIASASLGSSNSGARTHAFSSDRGRDQRPAASPAVIARTRQKYVPLASDVFSVAAVLRVRNEPLSTTEPKPASAATWNSYSAAPRTARHAKEGTVSTTAPGAGERATGALSLAAAATGTTVSTRAVVTASDTPIRLSMDSPGAVGGRLAFPWVPFVGENEPSRAFFSGGLQTCGSNSGRSMTPSGRQSPARVL